MGTERRHRWPVLRFAKSELVVGPKVWVGCVLGAALIVLGVLVTPSNFWSGVGIGVAGILGALFGLLLQPTPRERDFTAEGASAVRGLLHIAEEMENTQILVTQLATIAPKNVRLSLGLVNAQDRIKAARMEMYSSMAEWDAIAPGSTHEVQRVRNEGKTVFVRLARETQQEGHEGGTDT